MAMPKKKPGMTPEEQSERFKRDAQSLIDAGELSPTEADERFDRIMSNLKLPKVDLKDS